MSSPRYHTTLRQPWWLRIFERRPRIGGIVLVLDLQAVVGKYGKQKDHLAHMVPAISLSCKFKVKNSWVRQFCKVLWVLCNLVFHKYKILSYYSLLFLLLSHRFISCHVRYFRGLVFGAPPSDQSSKHLLVVQMPSEILLSTQRQQHYRETSVWELTLKLFCNLRSKHKRNLYSGLGKSPHAQHRFLLY